MGIVGLVLGFGAFTEQGTVSSAYGIWHKTVVLDGVMRAEFMEAYETLNAELQTLVQACLRRYKSISNH